ncbi:MAG: hypothetical protein KAT69_08590, partial [Candidatus Aminicenantes bacterium]|nr:hypothetical protein [Candidatus Aminicenantes bacterium]
IVVEVLLNVNHWQTLNFSYSAWNPDQVGIQILFAAMSSVSFVSDIRVNLTGVFRLIIYIIIRLFNWKNGGAPYGDTPFF